MPEDKSDKPVIRTNYPSNSNASKDRARAQASEGKSEKKVEKVISGEVVQRKKPIGHKIAETFIGDDLPTTGNYVLFDVLLPAAKSMLLDAISQGAERLFFGDSVRTRRPAAGSRNVNHVAYNRVTPSNSPVGRASENDGPRNISNRGRAAHDFNEIILRDRGEAEEVLDALTELIRQYDVATVSDLYDLVGITGNFTDEKWGWTDLSRAGHTRVRDGYLLNLPRTEYLD